MPGPPWGITAAGFNLKPFDQILADINTSQLQKISPSLDVQPTALMGVINGIVAKEASDLWEQQQALYNGMDRDSATGDQLAGLNALLGVYRDGASRTQVAADVTVGAGFSAAPGTMIAKVDGTSFLFTNKETVTSVGGGTISALFQAEDTGPIQCLAHSLVIATPLTGWTAIDNPADGTPGTAIETDPAFRLRGAQEITAPGSTTADAIRADVLGKLVIPATSSDTINCTVLHNDTDLTDANGLPPHSVEVIAYQPGNTADDDIALAQLILDSKGAGIGTSGTASKVVSDSQGNAEEIFYTRPAELDLYIEITVQTDPKTFPLDGATQVKNALLAYGDLEFAPGSDVYVKPLQGQVFPTPIDPTRGVAGVIDVTVFKIDTVTPAVNTANLPVGLRQIAKLDSARITVTVI